MTHTQLGKTGLRVSKLCLGTMNFGVDTDEKESFRIMDAALDAGINFYDTANVYGWGENAGITEKIIGNWFAQGNSRRERVVLATKVHEDICCKDDGPNSAPGLSLYKIRRHLASSMKRLQTDHIELYYMHHIDRSVGWEELWGALEPVVNSGMVDYIGSSNFAGWDIAVAQAAAARRSFLGLVCEQHKYNLNCRLPELEVLPSAKHHNVGVIPYSPLDGGMLKSGVLNNLASGSRSNKKKSSIEANSEKLKRFEIFAKDFGHNQEHIAMAWLLTNDAVDSIVIGPRSLEQFYDSLKCMEIKLGEPEMKKLDEIFPGPGGTAPNAYAW